MNVNGVYLWKIVAQPVNLRRIVGQADACTCHVPSDSRFGRHDVGRRPIMLLDGSSEWQHVDDATAASTHHIHVERDSSDCDGGHGDYYVKLPNHRDAALDEFSFWMHEVRWLANPAVHSEGTMTLRHHDDGTYSGSWSAPTDEGFEHESYRLCRNPHCAYERHSVYDQFAQAAGY